MGLFQRTMAAVFVEEAASFVELPGAQKCLRLAGMELRRWKLREHRITREKMGG
jgi:hypothetical protein